MTTLKFALKSLLNSKTALPMTIRCLHCGPWSTHSSRRKSNEAIRNHYSIDSFEDLPSVFGRYEKVGIQKVSEKLPVPESIVQPDYCSTLDGAPSKPILKQVKIHTASEINLMRESCRLAKYVLETTLQEATVGVSTDELDKFAHSLIIKNSAYPSPLGYRKFPKSICTSVNNVACHGIPDCRPLVNGDIISIDVMVFKNGFHGDCCGTTLVGDVDAKGQHLVETAKECTALGTQICKPGVPFSSIGKIIEDYALEQDLTVIPYFTGHGVGRNIHEKPDIYHYERLDENPSENVMRPGMIFTVEPIIAQGMELVTILSDGWTAATVDSGRAAQFENTILITPTGCEILTTTNT